MNLERDAVLPNCAFHFNLRRYNKVEGLVNIRGVVRAHILRGERAVLTGVAEVAARVGETGEGDGDAGRAGEGQRTDPAGRGQGLNTRPLFSST